MPVNWHGEQAILRMRVAAARGLNRASTALLAESNRRVPVDSRDLRRSGATHDATPTNLESTVSYNTPYAVIQHERLDFHHPQDHNPGAQAKYLERPARELEQKLMDVVATTIRREMG